MDWDGTFNARDLGGLTTWNGARTRWGAAVRADSLAALTGAGWEALLGHGVRTIVDLRNEYERREDAAPRPASVRTIHLPLDVAEDREFWGEWRSGPQFATPLYYRSHIERFPERNAEVIAAIAGAEPGGVVFHCVGGRDRSGQVAMLLLHLVGVDPAEIAADYELSTERLHRFYRARGEEDQAPAIEAELRTRGTTASGVIAGMLGEIDVESTLRRGGLTDADLGQLRARMLDSRAPRPGR